jgi:hypothetical protein
MNKEQRNTTGLNLQIPLNISMALSKRVCDLKESGSLITKSELILHYANRGLHEDQDGQSVTLIGEDLKGLNETEQR